MYLYLYSLEYINIYWSSFSIIFSSLTIIYTACLTRVSLEPTIIIVFAEWFWPRDSPDLYGQLCWSNASLIEFMIVQVKAILKKQPGANIISVSQNDNYHYCQSPEEMAIIKEEGTPGGSLFRGVSETKEPKQERERERERNGLI